MNSSIKLARGNSLVEDRLSKQSTPTLSHSLSINLKKSSLEVDVPEDRQNTFHALKQLKKINDYKEMLKGRLKVLQIEQKKAELQNKVNKNRYKFHQKMHDQILLKKQKKAQHHQKLSQQLSQAQQRAQRQRKQRIDSLKNAQKQLNAKRLNDYFQTKQKQAQIQRAISNSKMVDIQLKRQRKLQIRQYQKSQRNNVEQYLKNKRLDIRQSDTSSARSFNKIKQAKQQQIQQLNQMEQFLIQKQAKSRLIREDSASKLNKFINRGSLSNSNKLPLIKPTRRNSEHNIVC